jgi:23S rRNA (guanosine2251-2'-O)-methyltransferase
MARRRTTDGADADAPLVVYGANAVRELLRSAVTVTRVYLGPGPHEAPLEALARRRGAPVVHADRATLARLAGTPHHQGTVAVAAPFVYSAFARLLEEGCGSLLLLDGIQDPRNLGAILRTARAAGVGGVVLPRDRSVGVTPVVVAAAAGVLFGLPIARVPNLVRAMEALKAGGFWLVGLTPRDGLGLYELARPARPALVVGGEGEGLRALVRRSCDFLVSIPMASGVESLNVAVAVGIVLWEVLQRPR